MFKLFALKLASVPIIVLLFPVLFKFPELFPTPTLLLPVVLIKDWFPIEVFEVPVVNAIIDSAPTEVLPEPVVKPTKLAYPTLVLLSKLVPI